MRIASRQPVCRSSRKSKAEKRQHRRDKRKRDSDLKACYTERNQILKSLGFVSYAEYLQSDLWSKIRARVLSAAGHRCHGCKGHANEVHHRSYCLEVLVGRNLAPLVAICRKCHKQIEFDQQSNKTSLAHANGRLKKKRKTLTAASKQKRLADSGHMAYRLEIEEIKRSLRGRARNVALADAVRRRSASIGRPQAPDGKRFNSTRPTAEATAQR